MPELRNIIVDEIPSLGYGNPDGISLDKKIENGVCTEIDIEFAVEVIKSAVCMLRASKKDCGCIDGRRAEEVHFVNKDGENIINETDDSSIHERYKVAGGGYITAIGMLAGIDKADGYIEDDMVSVINDLSADNIYCGTHNGPHDHGEKSDCGANDNMRLILENGVRFRNGIKDNIISLLSIAGIDADEATVDNIFDNWNKLASNDEYWHESSGASRHDIIKGSINDASRNQENPDSPLAVSKKLAGDHQESFIVINYCDGMTFSQPTFRNELAKQYPDKDIDTLMQTFVIDIARIEQIAKSVADANSSDYIQTLSAGIAYQLATAATLTDGSLRTFIVKQ